MAVNDDARTEDDDVLDYATLAELRGDDDGDGPLDHPCPLCGPERQAEYNRTRATLRTWKPDPGFITYYCARCEAKGYAHVSIDEPRPRIAVPPPAKPRAPSADLHYIERLWETAAAGHPIIAGYFRWRGIPLDHVPSVLRYHPACPWQGKPRPCILARYSDALTGEPRGIWRRSTDGLNAPMTLGPMGGCAIRLYPDVGKRLVIGEGIETTLAAATQLTHRGQPLHPAWATGCAGNMRRFPVLDGVEQLVILADNDSSGTGQKAAAECARRWTEAGCEVVRLTPRQPDTDFNDLVRP